jgi:hypothetical protein
VKASTYITREAVQFKGMSSILTRMLSVVTLHFTPLPMKVVEARFASAKRTCSRSARYLLRPPAWYIESWYPERNDLCRWTSGRAAALAPAKAWIDVTNQS